MKLTFHSALCYVQKLENLVLVQTWILHRNHRQINCQLQLWNICIHFFVRKGMGRGLNERFGTRGTN